MHHGQDTMVYQLPVALAASDRGWGGGVVCEQGAKDNPKNPSRDGDWEELEWAVERQVNYAGCERRHSSLDYRSPIKVRGSSPKR